MQPYFFPYIGYFQLIQAVDRFVIYDDVNFIKGGWINRNRISIDNKPVFINAELNKVSSNRLICETSLSTSTKWKKKLQRKISQTYAKAPFVESVTGLVSDCLAQPGEDLGVFLTYSIQRISDLLGIETIIIPSSRGYGNQQLKGEERVIDICLRENATSYINAMGGYELYSSSSFKAAGLDLCFLKPHTVSYQQLGDRFIPNLSIIDVLMFNSPNTVKELLGSYELMSAESVPQI